MTLEELLKDKDFQFMTNLELILYKLLEESGVAKGDILTGKYDIQIGKAMDKIMEQLKKLALKNLN